VSAGSERFWAMGYAYESAAVVMDYVRTSLGLTRIAATTAPGNRGSRNAKPISMSFIKQCAIGGEGDFLAVGAPDGHLI
jgi:hypothetical protein